MKIHTCCGNLGKATAMTSRENNNLKQSVHARATVTTTHSKFVTSGHRLQPTGAYRLIIFSFQINYFEPLKNTVLPRT